MWDFFLKIFIRILQFVNITLQSEDFVGNGYKTFAECKTDISKVRQNPNDRNLLDHVKRRVIESSTEIQKQVKSYLLNSSLEKNPWEAFQEVLTENPDHYLVVSSEDNPWFEC